MAAPARPKQIGTAEAHESAFVRTVVEPSHRERWGMFFRSDRRKVLEMLDRMQGIDLRRMTRVTPTRRDAEVAAIIAELERGGAPETVYAISTLDDLDGRFVPLAQGIDRLVGWQAATYLSCIPGRLGYLEAEGENARYIFKNPDWTGA